jgi:polysaccharide biosynthesis PFTS motif protein
MNIRFSVRAYIKAYEENIKNGKIFIFRDILTEFSKSHSKCNIPGTTIPNNFIDKAYNQIIYARFFNKDLYYKINKALCNINFLIMAPIPANYGAILEKHNIKFLRYSSSMLFLYILIKYYLYGILFSIKYLFTSLKFVHYPGGLKESIYVHGVHESYFNGAIKYNLYSFLEKNYGKSVAVTHSCGSLPNSDKSFYVKNAFDLPISSWFGYLRFFYNTLRANLIAFGLLLLGHWQFAFLLSEIIKYYRISESIEHASKTYLFPYSNSAYRPIWTYALKLRGIKSESFFYSTYESPSIKKSNSYDFKVDSLYLSSWDTFYVWDERHANLLKNNLSKDTEIIISGPISISDCFFAPAIMCADAINLVIFDIPPFRKLLNWPWSSLAEYEQIDGVKEQFLEDIISLKKIYSNINIYIKSKRALESSYSRNYLHFINKNIKSGNLIRMDSNVSPRRLADLNFLSVSFPCTSAALYFHIENSVYYDPLSLIEYNNSMFRNRKLLTGVNALSAWISSRGQFV